MPHAQPPVPALLLVDDTPSIRQVFTHLLSGIVPYEVVAVGNAEDALVVLAARPVPIVIADYHLPGLDGTQLAAIVKSRSPDSKFVLITADIDVEGMQLGADVDVCLIKPFPLRELSTVVRDLLPELA